MPSYGLLYVDGIAGDCEIQGYEEHSIIFEVEHQVQKAFDVATGMPTGLRRHGALTVLKWVDRMTVPLSKALCRSENIHEVRLLFFQPPVDPGTFGQQHAFTITLGSARVSHIRPYVPISFARTNEFARPLEHVSFIYHTITWMSVTGGTEHIDSWV